MGKRLFGDGFKTKLPCDFFHFDIAPAHAHVDLRFRKASEEDLDHALPRGKHGAGVPAAWMDEQTHLQTVSEGFDNCRPQPGSGIAVADGQHDRLVHHGFAQQAIDAGKKLGLGLGRMPEQISIEIRVLRGLEKGKSVGSGQGAERHPLRYMKIEHEMEARDEE